MAEQKQWNFCQHCSCMFFGGAHARGGRCITESAHVGQGFEFFLPFSDGPEEPFTQSNWFFCRKCRCMFFVAIGGNAGLCVAGGGHDSTGSFNFHLPHSVKPRPNTQPNWRFCRKCGVLFFGGNPGTCVQGGGHNGAGSFSFVLAHGTKFLPSDRGGFVGDYEGVPVED
jgi:hypothetical protein